MSRARHHGGGHHKGHHKRASGGTVYAGKGSETEREAEDKTDTFKHGGRHHGKKHMEKRKHGGKVHGEKSHHRADRPARRAASGRSPLSAAAGSKGRPGGKYDGHPDARDD